MMLNFSKLISDSVLKFYTRDFVIQTVSNFGTQISDSVEIWYARFFH